MEHTFLWRNMMRLLTLVFCFCLSVYASSHKLVGFGFSPSLKVAKQEALEDLASQISIEISASFEQRSQQEGNKAQQKLKHLLKTSTKLPLFAVSYKQSLKQEYEVQAFFDVTKAKKLYLAKLKKYHKSIQNLKSLLQKARTKKERYTLLSTLLSKADTFYKLESVALFLELKNTPKLHSFESLKQELQAMQESFDSLKNATAFLAKQFQQEKIVLYPPRLKHSQEITPFASAFKRHLQSHLQLAKATQAEYVLRGNYELLNNKVFLTYTLENLSGENLSSVSIKLNPKAYEGLRTKAQNLDFETLLEEGVIKSNDFNIELKTTRGKQDLLFNKGESLSLFVKANRACYFYVVGHVLKQSHTFSYVVELSEGHQNRKFLYFINADDANRWIELGTFEVDAPFGFESLQVIASTKDLVHKVPATRYNEVSGYYELLNKPAKNLLITRGLKPKKSKKALVSESILRFTTLP